MGARAGTSVHESGAISSESQLAAVASAAAGRELPSARGERRLPADLDHGLRRSDIAAIRAAIRSGGDPLGEAFCRIRSRETRRAAGATYTPAAIVDAMVAWAAAEDRPARIVDPGAGSGRFLLAAARRFPEASLVAIETDPLAGLILRANAAVLGASHRLSLIPTDYRRITLPAIARPTLFIGNPPYVRHHAISGSWKEWFAAAAAGHAIKASKLAGLHIHFFFKTRELARDGDYGAFITAAEWLDVNYGAALRHLLANGLGGSAVHLLAPQLRPFADAMTTGAIACFRVGERPARLRIRFVESLRRLDALGGGRSLPWATVEPAARWSTLVRPGPKRAAGRLELGELFAVHRGQVTGANGVWIAGRYSGPLPARFLVPTVTRARELFAAGGVLDGEAAAHLRRLIDLPVELDGLEVAERTQVGDFLAWARRQDADKSYVARHRRAWWSVGLYAPAPILCTYMARRPPAFVRNRAAARHLNIAHGLYPRQPVSEAALAALAAWLRRHVRPESGRTYAGGLIKFEPREIERLPIPALETLTGRSDA
jgi:hypothetical protein